jgi:hypothetical protein
VALADGLQPVARQARGDEGQQVLSRGEARLVLLKVVADFAVGRHDPADGFGRDLRALVDGGGGDQAFDVEVVRVGQEPHERHGVVGLVLDVGEDEDAGFGRGGADEEGGAEQEAGVEIHGVQRVRAAPGGG